MSIPVVLIYWDTCKVKYALPFSSQILETVLNLIHFICQQVNYRTAAGRVSDRVRLTVQYDEFKTQYF
jgi:hypothetical protein